MDITIWNADQRFPQTGVYVADDDFVDADPVAVVLWDEAVNRALMDCAGVRADGAFTLEDAATASGYHVILHFDFPNATQEVDDLNQPIPDWDRSDRQTWCPISVELSGGDVRYNGP